MAAPHKFSDPDLTLLQLHALSAQVWYSVRMTYEKNIGRQISEHVLAQWASEAYVCGGFYNRACLAGLEYIFGLLGHIFTRVSRTGLV